MAVQGITASVDMPGFYQCTEAFPRNPGDAEFRTAASLSDQEGSTLPRLGAARVRNPEANSSLIPCVFLNCRSIDAVRALDAKPGECVLDLCAGVGGKSLALATSMFGPQAQSTGGVLVCNEPSKSHRAVMEDMLGSFLPSETYRRGGPVQVTAFEIPSASSSSSQAKVVLGSSCLSIRCSYAHHYLRIAAAVWMNSC